MNWFQKLRSARPGMRAGTPQAPIAAAPLNLSQLHIKTAKQLVQSIELDNLLRSIRRLVAIQEMHWNALYQPLLDRFLEGCQLAPASTAHHHAGPGGLAAHTLESVEIALQLRKPLVLPRRADPDTSAHQEHVWTYALFLAVLLHDLGKLSTSIRIRLHNGQIWTPYLRMDQLLGKPYQIEFVAAPYRLHTRIANASLHLIPKAGMAWLSQYPEILAHVCAWLYGDQYEAGIIGELAQKADGESVARNLKNGGDRVRFSGAPAIPLVDRLVIGLRQMLEHNELKLNSNGADGWSDGTHLWLVCGTVAKKLIEYLRQSGMANIPTDNNRIFDIFQEHGFIVPTDDKKAIWHTVVTGPESNPFRFELTMLKFELARLLPPTRRPAPFAGRITEAATPKQPPSPVAQTPTAAATIMVNEAATAPVTTATGPAQDTETITSNMRDAATTHDLPEWMIDEAGERPTEAAPVHTASNEGSSQTNAEPLAKNGPPLTTTSPLNDLTFDDIRPCHIDDNTGQKFLDWLARMLRHSKLPVNRQDAVIHIVNEGALVVSPRAFKEFVAFFDLLKRENGSAITADEAAKHIQKRVEKLRQNIKNGAGMSVHTYTIAGPNRSSRVSGFLFDPIKLFGHVTPPPPNPLLKK